jgi:hypothetical protein
MEVGMGKIEIKDSDWQVLWRTIIGGELYVCEIYLSGDNYDYYISDPYDDKNILMEGTASTLQMAKDAILEWVNSEDEDEESEG